MVIFDIGGVLVKVNKAPLTTILSHHGFCDRDFFDRDFTLLQTGAITPKEFFLKKSLKLGILAEQILQAFNQILEIGEAKAILKELKVNYIFASNINRLHFEYFQERVTPSQFSQQFSQLSYQVGYLKPQLEFFDFIKPRFLKNPSSALQGCSNLLSTEPKPSRINNKNFQPANLQAQCATNWNTTLFIDDKQENLLVAKQLGLISVLCTAPDNLPRILKNFGLL